MDKDQDREGWERSMDRVGEGVESTFTWQCSVRFQLCRTSAPDRLRTGWRLLRFTFLPESALNVHCLVAGEGLLALPIAGNESLLETQGSLEYATPPSGSAVVGLRDSDDGNGRLIGLLADGGVALWDRCR